MQNPRSKDLASGVVSSPPNWYFDIQQNILLIKQIIDRARIFRILRYWNIRNPGPLGETPINFADFRPFGVWKAPTVKQFGQRVS
ncbi:hypothetical protein ANCDUO_18204, partial [Ancylostoma duodenale]